MLGPALRPGDRPAWKARGTEKYTVSRAAPPSGRRLRLRAPPRTPPPRPAAVPAALRARCRRIRDDLAPERRAHDAAGAGPGPPPRAAGPPRRGRHRAPERRHGADRAVVDRRERQAGHVELDLQPRPARPCDRGLRRPGQRGPRRRRPVVRQHDRPRRPGSGVPDGLLPGPRWPSRRADGLRRSQGPARPGRHSRHLHRVLPVDAHPDAQCHEGLAAGLLPLEAGRQRRRGAVRAAHRPR